jgi:hypothetical protein
MCGGGGGVHINMFTLIGGVPVAPGQAAAAAAAFASQNAGMLTYADVC